MFFFFMLPHICASCVKISLTFIYSFDVWVAPSWGNQNTQRKRDFIVKWQSYKLLNFKDSCEKHMAFIPKMAAKGYNFCKVWIVFSVGAILSRIIKRTDMLLQKCLYTYALHEFTCIVATHQNKLKLILCNIQVILI